MWLDKDHKIKGYKILANTRIHEKAKFSRKTFLDKVKFVKYIRTQSQQHYISLYITNSEEYYNFRKFYDLINFGNFDLHENYHVFAVGVPLKLYDWFKNTNIGLIEKQITNWLAGLYFFEIERRNIMQRQLFPHLFDKILEIVEKYYSDYQPINIEDYEDDYELYEAKEIEEYSRTEDKYIQVCKEFYGGKPPDLLKSPYNYKYDTEYGVTENFGFEIIYLTPPSFQHDGIVES